MKVSEAIAFILSILEKVLGDKIKDVLARSKVQSIDMQHPMSPI